MSQGNIALVRRLFEDGWSTGNFSVVDEVTSEDWVDHDPAAGGDADRERVKQRMQTYRSAFPDLRFHVEDVVASGDKVAIRWRSDGTFENELYGLHPTHERGTVTGMGIARIEGGKIVESWNQWDNTQLMRDIGALPQT